MKGLLRRLRGMLGMGLTWAGAWGGVGVLIGVGLTLGLPLEWFIRVFDAPLPALALPGFFAGATFSAVLGVVGRRRRFDELSLPVFAAWGALGGLVLSLAPAAAVVGTLGVGATAVVVGTLTVLSSLSAAGTLALARVSEDRALLASSEDVADVGLSAGETRDLLGR